MSIRTRICAATPVFCVAVFLAMGFCFELWQYAWLVFFLIPLMPCLVGKKRIVITAPFIVVVIYLILGFVFDAWHPGWLVFFTIPIYYILFGNKRLVIRKKHSSDYIDADGEESH